LKGVSNVKIHSEQDKLYVKGVEESLSY